MYPGFEKVINYKWIFY